MVVYTHICTFRGCNILKALGEKQPPLPPPKWIDTHDYNFSLTDCQLLSYLVLAQGNDANKKYLVHFVFKFDLLFNLCRATASLAQVPLPLLKYNIGYRNY